MLDTVPSLLSVCRLGLQEFILDCGSFEAASIFRLQVDLDCKSRAVRTCAKGFY
jgi:hypothetical protein